MWRNGWLQVWKLLFACHYQQPHIASCDAYNSVGAVKGAQWATAQVCNSHGRRVPCRKYGWWPSERRRGAKDTCAFRGIHFTISTGVVGYQPDHLGHQGLFLSITFLPRATETISYLWIVEKVTHSTLKATNISIFFFTLITETFFISISPSNTSLGKNHSTTISVFLFLSGSTIECVKSLQRLVNRYEQR